MRSLPLEGRELSLRGQASPAQWHKPTEVQLITSYETVISYYYVVLRFSSVNNLIICGMCIVSVRITRKVIFK
jgi:hypothetical protein